MPTLTAYATMDPQPRVQVAFDEAELDPATVTISVLQISDAGEVVVRDADRRSALGGFVVVDYEVPLGLLVTYQAREFDVNGAVVGLTDSASVTVSIPVGMVVVSDPLASGRAVLVQAAQGFLSEISASRPLTRYQVGRSTVALMGELRLPTGIPLPVVTFDDASSDALYEILAEGSALFRMMPAMGIRRPLYVSVGSVGQVFVGFPAGASVTTWPVVADEISRTDLDTILPAVTWQRYVDAFDTWQDMIDVYTTWLDAITDPPAED